MDASVVVAARSGPRKVLGKKLVECVIYDMPEIHSCSVCI